MRILFVRWGVSFYFGFRDRLMASSLLEQNYQYLRTKAGEDPQSPSSWLRPVGWEQLEGKIATSGHFGLWQFRCLATRAVFYILWHVLEMYIRTPLPSLPH
jgi:hypothetical protein